MFALPPSYKTHTDLLIYGVMSDKKLVCDRVKKPIGHSSYRTPFIQSELFEIFNVLL